MARLNYGYDSMSLSAIDKIDALSSKSASVKSDFTSLWGGAYAGYIPTGDLTRDDWGAAAAYAVIAEVLSAMAVWEIFLDGVTWIVRDKKSGAEIARTDKQSYPLEERGGKWFAAVKRFESSYFHSYWKSLAFSDWLYGNSYIALLHAEQQYRPNSTLYAGLKWLNPLNTYPMVINNQIQYYQYTGLDIETTHQIPPADMAYRINRRDAFNDLRGYSGVLAAMDAINLSRNAIRAFKNFFSQGMILGGVISPKEGDTWSDRELENARREWSNNHKGAANAGRWAVLPKFANVVPFGQEDASSNFNVTKELRNTIFMAVGVPPQIAGDPSDSTYDNAKDIKRQWWETRAIPYAKDIAGFNSTVVIPKLEPDANVYIEADVSAYEIDKPDVISQDINAGIITISTAQAKRGYKVDEDLSDVYLIGNVPMSKAVIRKLADTIPSQYQLDIAKAEQAQAAADTPVSPTPATPVTPNPIPVQTSRPLGDNPENDLIDEPTPTAKHVHSHDDLPPIVIPDSSSELEELGQWRKFLINGKSSKRTFEQKALRGDIGDAIQSAVESGDKQIILDAFQLAQEKIEAKYLSLNSELAKWKTFSLTQFKAGKLEKALSFKSLIIPSLLHEAISAVIADAKTVDELYNVFADAERWESHHA